MLVIQPPTGRRPSRCTVASANAPQPNTCGLVALRRDLHVERLVRPFVIEAVDEIIEPSLLFREGVRRWFCRLQLELDLMVADFCVPVLQFAHCRLW